MATIRIRAGQSRAKLYFGLSVVAGLGLLIGLGVGWQTQLRGHGNKTAVTASQRVETSAPQGDAAFSSVPASTGAAAAAAVSAEHANLILVASADQAATVEQGISQADEIRAQTGLPPLNSTVITVAADFSAETAVRALMDENTTRAALGLPQIEVVDLRTAGAQVSDVPAAAGYVLPASVTGQPSYVLVGSSDQQSEVSREIEDANVIRAGMGLAPLDVTVWNFVTEADEANTMAALSAENQFRDLIGMPVIRVVDLRN
jgi:phosphopantetheine adenylyltransferase